MRFRTLKFAVVVAASATAGCAPATDQPNAGIDAPGVAAIEAAATIDAEKLRETVTVLASDEFEGRGPASSGDIMTQRYLSTALKELGYTPAGVAGSWLQPFDIVSVTTTTPESWSFTGNGNTLVLRQWDEFIVSSGVQEPSAEVRDAEVVFVGYGLQAPEYDWDDYKGLDVSGKLLLMLNNDPDWDPDLFEGNRRASPTRRPRPRLARRGRSSSTRHHRRGIPFRSYRHRGAGRNMLSRHRTTQRRLFNPGLRRRPRGDWSHSPASISPNSWRARVVGTSCPCGSA